MNEQISAADAIQQAPPGMMVFARVKVDPAREWETAFLIREELRNVKAFGRDPAVEMRAGLMYEDAHPARRVALIPVMLRIGAGKAAQLYECWFNFHASENRETFADLAAQFDFGIVFFTPERTKGVRVKNGMQTLFARALAALTPAPAWSMREFDAAREKIYRAYPAPYDLWRALEGMGGNG